ncbi:MAG: imidazoleglycerol-phosphate dehydratase HisB [bacterium]
MKKRTCVLTRKTSETNIKLNINLDGRGSYAINTTIPFMDHMLNLFAKHARIDLNINARGDTDIDNHHLVEDLGIALGDAINRALGNKQGIRRFGEASAPMDESLVTAQVDISGRPYLVFNIRFSKSIKDSFDYGLIEDFYRAVSFNSKITLHLNKAYGRDNHHIAESSFKAFALALAEAVSFDKKVKGMPSTKGKI